MGCRTGFYLLTRSLPHNEAISLVKDAYSFIAGFDGEIPGCSEKECGNYLEHDLEAAKKDVLPLVKSEVSPERDLPVTVFTEAEPRPLHCSVPSSNVLCSR